MNAIALAFCYLNLVALRYSSNSQYSSSEFSSSRFPQQKTHQIHNGCIYPPKTRAPLGHFLHKKLMQLQKKLVICFSPTPPPPYTHTHILQKIVPPPYSTNTEPERASQRITPGCISYSCWVDFFLGLQTISCRRVGRRCSLFVLHATAFYFSLSLSLCLRWKIILARPKISTKTYKGFQSNQQRIYYKKHNSIFTYCTSTRN
jgi:hypothetical protein